MKSFWDNAAGIYDIKDILNGRVVRGIEMITEENVPRRGRVLDCAAGTGMLTLAAAPAAGSVLSTDASGEMLKRAVNKARRRGLYNIRFARRDICSLRDKSESFDCAMAGNVIHLLPEPEKALSELVRVTKKGGKILIPTYVTGYSAFSRAAVRFYTLLGFDPKREFTPGEYEEFMRKMSWELGCSGCRVIFVKGIFPASYAVITK